MAEPSRRRARKRSGDYAVGLAKPPKASKPGKLGYPMGRPKQSLSLEQIFVEEGGRSKSRLATR